MFNMQEDKFPAAERIISDIVSVFKKDPKLKEFEIIAVTQNENKSPVIVQNHCLGLESWCVRHVFYHAYNRLMKIRQQKCRREDPNQMTRLLTTALLLNPDIATFWNLRRELVLSGYQDAHSELHFTAVVLSRKPKSAEVFSYRKWLIKNLLKDFPADPGLISDEFHVCDIAAERYPNNYYTWNHRIWCSNQFPTDCDKSLDVFVCEWINSKRWVSTHVSDHSGFQYRQHLLNKLISSNCKSIYLLRRTQSNFFQSLNSAVQSFFNQTNTSVEKSDRLSSINFNNLLLPSSDDCDSIKELVRPENFILGLICSELVLSNDLILMFIGHEALWYHRRFLVYTFHDKLIKNNKSLNVTELFKSNCDDSSFSHKNNEGIPFEKDLKIEDSVCESMKAHLLCFERNLFAQCTSDFQQSKAASKHKIWLENVLKMKLM